jgi:hypothetical protein
MKTSVPQKSANTGAIATPSISAPRRRRSFASSIPWRYTLRLESIRVPSRLKLRQHWRSQRELLKRIWLTSDHRCAATD